MVHYNFLHNSESKKRDNLLKEEHVVRYCENLNNIKRVNCTWEPYCKTSDVFLVIIALYCFCCMSCFHVVFCLNRNMSEIFRSFNKENCLKEVKLSNSK